MSDRDIGLSPTLASGDGGANSSPATPTSGAKVTTNSFTTKTGAEMLLGLPDSRMSFVSPHLPVVCTW